MIAFEAIVRADNLPSPFRIGEALPRLVRVGVVQCAWHPDAAEHRQVLSTGVRLAAEAGAHYQSQPGSARHRRHPDRFGILGVRRVGSMLLLAVALPTRWFPAGGFGTTATDHLRSIVLPGLTLAIGMAPILVRSLRASILSTLDQDHVATARSIGLPERLILRRFVLRNAATSSVTLIALEIGFLLFGAVVVESAFALPGVGQGLVLAARGRDLPAIQGYTLLFAVGVVAVNLVADVVTALLDPRAEITA